jgi:hypothetical protein
LPGPSPTPGRQASPRLLPPSGAAVLATAAVTVAQAPLHDQPGNNAPIVASASRGAPLGVLGQNAAGDWLLVMTSRGATGWVARAATDYAGAAPAATSR